MLASVVWWAVFYSPGDLVYSLAKTKLLYVPVCVAKEVYRAKKVVAGMADASKLFPDNEMIILMIGALKVSCDWSLIWQYSPLIGQSDHAILAADWSVAWQYSPLIG